MAYITYAPVDRQFQCLERDAPQGAPFNGVDPVDGITFGFSLSSRYPLAAGVPDVRYGTVAKKPADDPDILLRVITKAEYDAAEAAEMAAREAKLEPNPTANFIPIPIFRQRLEKLGMFDDFAAYLAQFPALQLKVLTLEAGLDPAYPDVLAAFATLNVPQAYQDYLTADPSNGVPDVPNL